jgi:dTDP-4-amino-4,6-dideoxygalactose transaminase
MQPKLPAFILVKPYLELMDESKFYSNCGPLVKMLEKKFSVFLGVHESQVILCSNATLALQGAYFLSEPKKIFIPNFTFPATPLAVIAAGKELHLTDISLNDFHIDVDSVELGEKDALSPVIPFGSNFELKKYNKFKNVIFDAAASLGNQNLGLSKLKQSHAVVFSLHATKILGIGEGGLVVFGDYNKANEFRSYLNFGFSGSRDSKILGTNAKMSEIQAAYGHAVLDDWDVEKQEWLSVREKAKRVENNFPELFNHNLEMAVSPYWLSYSTPEIKAEIVKTFQRFNIETRDWWSRGIHNMPAFSKYKNKAFPITEKVSDSSIGLPLFRDMKDSDFDRIHEALSNVGR